MNKGVPTSATAPGRVLRSDRMLAELLALNEEMIVQLRVERTEATDEADFITAMIKQHEKAAEHLRAQLLSHKTAALGKPLTC